MMATMCYVHFSVFYQGFLVEPQQVTESFATQRNPALPISKIWMKNIRGLPGSKEWISTMKATSSMGVQLQG